MTICSRPCEQAAFVRGYFDAEGGVPRRTGDRFYIQSVQKDLADLEHVRSLLGHLGIRCGRIHNPSARADPDYWRFYVLAASHQDFALYVGSWHPRKRPLVQRRLAASRWVHEDPSH